MVFISINLQIFRYIYLHENENSGLKFYKAVSLGTRLLLLWTSTSKVWIFPPASGSSISILLATESKRLTTNGVLICSRLLTYWFEFRLIERIGVVKWVESGLPESKLGKLIRNPDESSSFSVIQKLVLVPQIYLVFQINSNWL